MPRKKNVNLIRKVSPDPKFNSVLVATLCNKIMYDGKKSKAENIVWKAMDLIAATTGMDPVLVSENAKANLRIIHTLKRARVGGANHQVPVLAKENDVKKAFYKFLIPAVRSRGERTMYERLGKEIIDASNNTGIACKKHEEHKKTVESNRAFARG